MAYVHIAVALAAQRRFSEAVVELDNAQVRMPGAPTVAALRGYIYSQTGRRQAALEIVKQLTDSPPSPFRTALDLPVLYLGLGDLDHAFQALNRACDEHLRLIELIKVDPLFDPLRLDPRYEVLLHRLNLTP